MIKIMARENFESVTSKAGIQPYTKPCKLMNMGNCKFKKEHKSRMWYARVTRPGDSSLLRLTRSRIKMWFVVSGESNIEESVDTQCGIFGHRIRCLRRFTTPLTFLLVFCSLSLVQGAYWTYFIGVITTIEKRYAFESKMTGLILLADNLSPIITSFIIGFFGGRGNRPVWLGAGMFVAGNVWPWF